MIIAISISIAIAIPRCLIALAISFACLAAEPQSPLSADDLTALVRSGSAAEVAQALQHGADVNSLNRDKRTALMEAVMWGVDDAVVSAVLAGSVDLNTRGWNGTAALHWVGWHEKSRASTIPLLVAAGADPAATDAGGQTALHTVMRLRDRPEFVTALLAAGVQLNQTDHDGWTALDHAREYRRTASIAVLLAAGATTGGDLLALMRTGPVDEIVARVRAQAIDLNVEHPCPNRKPAFVPMVEAVMNPDPQVLRALVTLGGKPNALGSFRETPLQKAAQLNPDPAIITTLIELGADLTGAPGDAGAPLSLAVDYNPKPAGVVAALLAAGADIHATDDKGRAALDLAERRPEVPSMAEAIAALKAAGAQRSVSLWDVLQHGTMDEITSILATKPDLNVRDQNGWTPLMWSVQYGRNGAVNEALIAGGAVATATDRHGRTAWAFLSLDPSVIAPLVAAGLPIDQGDGIGRTGLHLAVFNPRPEVIRALIAAGADPDAAAQDGSTARSVARERGDQDVLKLLDGGRQREVEATAGF